MTKSPSKNPVGDTIAPALKAQVAALREGPDQAADMQSDVSPVAKCMAPITNLAACFGGAVRDASSPSDCKQVLWLSFFFDGTGNNRDADLGTQKHSNVVRLYRVHKDDDKINGRYRFYIPGVGTYFDEIGDRGGTALGLGIGDKGQNRLDWALKQFDLSLRSHVARANSPANAISEINISAFGFSRGAALVRAFVNQLLKNRCERVSENSWRLQKGHFKVRVRFLGLFDTVASVGLPMSTNTTSVAGSMISVRKMIKDRRNDSAESRAERLAFAQNGLPGADPAPGKWNGHESWGDQMAIPEMVEEVRHFIAAHEIRNSFPVDSVSIVQDGLVSKPARFHETVYPGVHSDVGGSYRPGEGGRSYESNERLGLIPLMHMYEFAVARGVPLLPASAWRGFNREDFDVAPRVLHAYNAYMKTISGTSSLGQNFNSHMEKYFAWRFRTIRMKEQGDLTESKHIQEINKQLSSEEGRLRKEIEPLRIADFKAKAELERLRILRSYQISGGGPNVRETLLAVDAERRIAEKKQVSTQDELLRAEARLNALPQMADFYSTLSMYDQELINDALEIRKMCLSHDNGRAGNALGQRSNLRPHYKALLEAYENEYKHNAGLKDPDIIEFFDNFVHDSLAGFAKDATLPSDPRVIYLGGNEKFRYASVESGGSPSEDKIVLT